ncbi:lisH domain-containing protein C1711.05-like [Camellia sinensis]|uniref:lisH domain-containing protein C1711.05-like n=1 Tax=Camellia sinensis TaxID=4442 RepID=UPI001036DEA9|nr:lisH domain-containing protein C1711.05-like [Camellia sinensis]
MIVLTMSLVVNMMIVEERFKLPYELDFKTNLKNLKLIGSFSEDEEIDGETLHQPYEKLYNRSYTLTKINIKLSMKLIVSRKEKEKVEQELFEAQVELWVYAYFPALAPEPVDEIPPTGGGRLCNFHPDSSHAASDRSSADDAVDAPLTDKAEREADTNIEEGPSGRQAPVEYTEGLLQLVASLAGMVQMREALFAPICTEYTSTSGGNSTSNIPSSGRKESDSKEAVNRHSKSESEDDDADSRSESGHDAEVSSATESREDDVGSDSKSDSDGNSTDRDSAPESPLRKKTKRAS